MVFKIKEARERAGLTQSQLADKLGISFATLSGYETGRHDPRSDTLAEIARICRTTTDYLLGREDRTNVVSHEAMVIAHKFDKLNPYSRKVVEALVDLELKRPSDYASETARFNKMSELPSTESSAQ